MAETIEEFVTERGIKCLLHFTNLTNLASILEHGLLPKGELHLADVEYTCNDTMRLDGTDAVCASISFPNYKMFWGLRQEQPNDEWVILVIYARVLFEARCAFCPTNAASASVTMIPLEERMTLAALQGMYGDFEGTARSELKLPNHYTTNPQAEVLLLDGVPKDYLAGVLVATESLKAKLKATHTGLRVKLSPPHFLYRHDYEHWR